MRTELLRERYEALEVVGRGGEGEVSRAVDHLHGRTVALKVRRVVDEAARDRLLSEARILLALSPHPGLPLVREDFFVDDRYVIAMDWIEGADLEALLDDVGRPGLDPALAVGYLEEAAAALEHLHTHDPPVVHGDVKPANLILTSSGRVVLVDFGLSSRPIDGPQRAGTAGYLAPEVAAGEAPTSASDVYSLAATALAVLTGEAPSGGAPSWGTLERERIPALERIMRSNLATDPAGRDATATAFVARLQRWWGAALPRGTVTLVLADMGREPGVETLVDEIARTHRGHCVAPVANGALTAVFASAQDGSDAARELASRFGARVAAVTAKSEPRAGRYEGEAASDVARLLEVADRGEVLIDDSTARSLDGQLAPEIGLAEVLDRGSPPGPPAWALVAPGLSIPPRAESSPYRGLMNFGSDDADLFFGREEVVTSIVARLLAASFIAVVGASGSGKSSLVHAGLVPAFRRARAGHIVVVTPGSDPAAQLERRLVDGSPSLLVVDQLEEVFTLCPHEASRARFIDALMDLREANASSIVVALRADFYGRCASYPRLASAVAEHQHLLGPMRVDELRRSIEGPARTAALRFEPGLVDAMLADVEGEPGALPLLSHALYESWAGRNGRVLTNGGYRAAGGVRGAIAHTAEEVFVGCGDKEQELMRRMFLRLTELGDATEDTRRRVTLAELIPENDPREAVAVLERLADARLLVVGGDSAEIAHEALIREWPRLRGWLTEDREELRAFRQLTTAARSWDETGRDDADLYRGPRLAAAAELGADGRQLSRIEREFLDASREADARELTSARRRARRLRVLLAVVAAALVAAVIAGAFALVQRSNARRSATVAQSGRLAAQSREVAAAHPDLGLLLALEAGRLDDSVDSRGTLLSALEQGSRIRAWLQDFESPVNAATFSPDGRLLATVTLGGTTLWDTTTWKPIGPPLRSSQGVSEWADFSPDGRILAIAGGEGRVELWDVSTRKEVRELKDPAAGAAGEPALAVVRYSPDGTVLAAGAMETNHVTLWDAATGRVIGRPIITHPPGSGGAHAIAFSPDSRRIAVPGAPGTIGIWEVDTGRRVGAPLRIGSANVEAAIFGEGGRTIIASDDAGSVTVVDVATRRLVGRPLSVGDEPAASLDLSPDGRLLAVASYAGSVFVWDTRSGAPYGSALTADTSPVNDVAFSADGRALVSAHLRSAVVWNMSGEQVLGEPLGGPTDLISDVAFSPDGERLVAGRLGGGAVVYDRRARRPAVRIGGDSVVTAVAFDPEGRQIALATVDGQVALFDARSGAQVGAPLVDEDAAIWQVAFSPDGKLLAVAVDPNGVEGFYRQQRQGEAQLWDVDSRRRVGRAIAPGGGSVLSVAFNRDGTLLATGSYFGRLDLWDVATQAPHGTSMRVADDGVLSVAFDASGRLLAGGGATGPVRVWRVADQEPAFPPLAGHTGPVTGTAFDSADSVLATTSLLGATRLWDPKTGLAYGDELAGSAKPASLVPSVDLPFLALGNAFSPDGATLAVAGVETRAMLWNVDPALWRQRACTAAGRNLSREEWDLYLPPGTPYRPTCLEWPTR